MHGASSDGAFKLDKARGHENAIVSSVFAFVELALEAPAAVATAVQALGPLEAPAAVATAVQALGPCCSAEACREAPVITAFSLLMLWKRHWYLPFAWKRQW